MKTTDLRAKSADELNNELLELLKAQFSLRMQRATGQAVKPHDFGRVRKDIARLKTVLAEVAPEAVDDYDAEIAPDAHAADRYEKMINIKDRGQIFRVDVADIERIDAAGDYMCIYTADQTLVLRETMKDLERRLDPKKFQRIHRSTIVNLDNIKSVKPHTNGECFLVLGSGTQVKVSRSYRDVVARFVH